MKNTIFELTSNTDKQRKLGTVLRNRTNDSLTPDQLQYIMQNVVSDAQYEIEVFTEPADFCAALILENSVTKCSTGEIVFGQALFGKSSEHGISLGQLYRERDSAAAIVTKSVNDCPKNTMRSILIYVPIHLYMKGAGTYVGQEFLKKACV